MLTIRTETLADRAAVMALWESCFHDSEAFMQWFFGARWLPAYGVVAEEDGRIVSAMQGYPYTLLIRGRRVPACMLSGVSTWEDCRGRGIMTDCLKRFMQQAAQKGCKAVFQTPVLHESYFRHLHYSASRTAFVQAKGRRDAAMPEGVICAADMPSMAGRLLPLYRACVADYSGVVDRSLADMEARLTDHSLDGGGLMYMQDMNGRITGYAVYAEEEDTLTATECMTVSASLRDTLLHGLIAKAGGRQLVAKLPPDMAQALPPGFFEELRPTGAMGAADITWLMHTLAGFSDVVAEISDSMVPQNTGRFDFDGKRSARTPDVYIDAGRLLQLLLGFFSAEELVRSGAARIDDPAVREALDNRLKKQICYVAEEY